LWARENQARYRELEQPLEWGVLNHGSEVEMLTPAGAGRRLGVHAGRFAD
jgi:hypothetical protein